MQEFLTPSQLPAHIEQMLSKVDKSVADKVREKYELDTAEFSAAATASQGNTSPKAWSKSNCNRCYGTGYCGTMIRNTKDSESVGKKILCTCAVRKYHKWLQGFRVEYLANKKEAANAAS